MQRIVQRRDEIKDSQLHTGIGERLRCRAFDGRRDRSDVAAADLPKTGSYERQ